MLPIPALGLMGGVPHCTTTMSQEVLRAAEEVAVDWEDCMDLRRGEDRASVGG